MSKEISHFKLQQAIDLALLHSGMPVWAPLVAERTPYVSHANFFFKIGDIYKSIFVKEIAYFFADQKLNYARVGQRNFPTSVQLKTLEHEFGAQFVRIHKSYLVNVSMIESINPGENSVFINEEPCRSGMRPGGISIVDPGSTNGSYIGPVRVERALLPPGTLVKIGGTTIRFDDAVRQNVPAPAPTALGGMIAGTPQMHRLFADISRVAASPTSVLVVGESGTGKERVAEALHERSHRQGPLVTIDCGALPSNLLASELFGSRARCVHRSGSHVRGRVRRGHRHRVSRRDRRAAAVGSGRAARRTRAAAVPSRRR